VILTSANAVLPSGLIWPRPASSYGLDAFDAADLFEDRFHRRLDLRVVDPLLGGEHDLSGEAGVGRTDRLELVDHLRRLGVGKGEVGAERRTGGAGHDVDPDQDRHPDGEDGDPFVRDAPTCETCEHA
jgi:hypothetical protein